MGLTESNSKQVESEEKYKLIRRYTSECYGDLTVVQNKQSSQYYALKELITQDDNMVNLIKERKNLRHRNLVLMEDHWFCNDQSICSNIRKVEMVFQYFNKNLEEEMKSRAEKHQAFSDLEILQILSDTIQCLKYLQDRNFLHLIGNMKMILFDSQTKTIKIMENQQMVMHSQRIKKKTSNMLNIIALLTNKKILPLHPFNQPKDVHEVCLTSSKVAHQNLFLMGLICLGLCWQKDPFQLGIFAKGCYNFEKIQKRISQIKNKFPSVYRILHFYMVQNKKVENISYSDVLGQIFCQKKSFSKQNERNQRAIDIQPLEKVGDKRKKNLQLREQRFSSNQIPNQF